MRLTDKMCNGEYLHSEASHYSTEICLDKLGQLEDIEEELGIDLITLFKALKNGVYYKQNNEIKQWVVVSLTRCQGSLELHFNNKFYYLKDYGKTWALTKEELL